LNKSDMISTQQLMRVYGALMWSLGKVIQTPEVTRVYIGSFWEQPLQIDDNRKLFEMEESDLFADLTSLPKNAAVRKLNDLIKRARLAKVHAYIISALREEMPSVFGKDKKKAELIKGLSDIYRKIQVQHDVSPGDFPNLQRMQENLQYHDFTKFPSMKPKLIQKVDEMLTNDITRLMTMIPHEADTQADENTVKGGVFNTAQGEFNPFAAGAAEGFNLGAGTGQWIIESEGKEQYDKKFEDLNPIDGKLSGAVCKREMVKSKLPKNALAKVWTLSDIDKDGQLDAEEFALAMYLIDVKLKDNENDLPKELPEHLIPPGKRKMLLGNGEA